MNSQLQHTEIGVGGGGAASKAHTAQHTEKGSHSLGRGQVGLPGGGFPGLSAEAGAVSLARAGVGRRRRRGREGEAGGLALWTEASQKLAGGKSIPGGVSRSRASVPGVETPCTTWASLEAA